MGKVGSWPMSLHGYWTLLDKFCKSDGKGRSGGGTILMHLERSVAETIQIAAGGCRSPGRFAIPHDSAIRQKTGKFAWFWLEKCEQKSGRIPVDKNLPVRKIAGKS